MRRKNGKLNFLTGIFFGGLIGGALALLYAPFPGKKMRKKVSEKTDDFLEDAEDFIKDSKEVYEDGKKKAESIIKEAKKLVNY
jgi:gas vesicle protein